MAKIVPAFVLAIGTLAFTAAPVVHAQTPTSTETDRSDSLHKVSLTDYLSDAEIATAIQAPVKKRHTTLIDMQSLFANTGSGHGKQIPQVDVYMPEAWIAAQAKYAKSQYQKYDPKPDSLRAITVVAVGIAMGTSSGPSCDSVSRIALISDKEGAVVIEAVQTDSATSTWHNGFGATASCKSATSKFLLTDVEKVRAAGKDEQFTVGVFYEGGSRKLYTVKKQYLKELGL